MSILAKTKCLSRTFVCVLEYSLVKVQTEAGQTWLPPEPLGTKGLPPASAAQTRVNASTSSIFISALSPCQHRRREGSLFPINHPLFGHSQSVPTRLPILMQTPVHLEQERKQRLSAQKSSNTLSANNSSLLTAIWARHVWVTPVANYQSSKTFRSLQMDRSF